MLKPALILTALLFLVLDAHASVVAKVDRGDVELNESFTLEIVIDSETNLGPAPYSARRRSRR